MLGDEESDATSCFAHSLVAVDDDWKALTPILGWRDTRSAVAAEWLARRLDAAAVHARTGAFLHPSFWPAKLAWLAETEPETFRRTTWFVSFADYLHGRPETSLSMASTSGLLDLTSKSWDAELLETLGIDEEQLPRVADLPLWSDAACSNAGAGCTGRERAALMVGTSGALRVVYESERPQPKPGLFLYLADERHVVEGGALSDGGNLYDWLERTLADTSGSLAERDPRDHGLVFLPFLGGERSTGWNPHARGGDPRAHVRDDAARPAAGRLRRRRVPLRGRRRPPARRARGRRDRRRAPARPRLDPDHGRRARAAGHVSGVAEASLRGAAVLALERLGHEVADAPIAEVVEPRPERAEAYRAAREEQQRLYDELYDAPA